LACSERKIWAALVDNRARHSICVSLEVLSEFLCKCLGILLVEFLIGPAVNGAQNFGIHTENGLGHLHTETAHEVSLGHIERIIMNRVNDSSSLGQTHSLANTVSTTDPACVDEPYLCAMSLALLSEHLSVLVRMQREESLTIASRESRYGFSDTHLCASDLRCVSRNELVHSLFRGKTRNRGEDTSSVASEENHVLRVATDSGQLNVVNVFERVAHAGVSRQAQVVVVDLARLVFVFHVHRVFDEGTKSNGIEDIGFSRAGKAIALCVAAAFDVEDVVVGPDVLVITDQLALGVRGEGSLACA